MSEIPLIVTAYELYRSLLDVTSRVDRRFRFGLAAKLEEQTLELLELLVMAKHAPKALKSGYLLRATGRLEVVRLCLRLLLEMKLANETNVFKLQEKAAEAGRMLGGWLRSLA
ncbi:MAG TPA: hypothetical protein VJJ47_02680 [Candidatus Paceibacterota bacterium]